ncbi:MAG: hypothetical protein RMN24_00030 [Anaerolineae bacterium]|nr:hypothetical protein [Anaerolineae bacterium]
MIAELKLQARRRDRLVDWLVVALVLVALLLGWGVKSAAEGRTTVAEVEGLSIRYPAGWLKTEVEPPVLLQVEEWLGPARSVITVQRRPLPAVDNPLAAVEQALTLERARGRMAYRTLETKENVAIAGRTAQRTAFAYVETDPNPFLQTMPVVMYGEDYLIPVGDQVYVVTLTAAEAYYDRARRALDPVIRSLPR